MDPADLPCGRVHGRQRACWSGHPLHRVLQCHGCDAHVGPPHLHGALHERLLLRHDRLVPLQLPHAGRFRRLECTGRLVHRHLRCPVRMGRHQQPRGGRLLPGRTLRLLHQQPELRLPVHGPGRQRPYPPFLHFLRFRRSYQHGCGQQRFRQPSEHAYQLHRLRLRKPYALCRQHRTLHRRPQLDELPADRAELGHPVR